LLIQQLIVIGISGVVMMVAIQIIHRALSFGGSFQKQQNANRSTSLLVRQFRFDSHDASSIALRDNRSLVFQTSNGKQVTYRANENYVEREEAANDSDALKRDRYGLGPNRVASLQETETAFQLLIATHAAGDTERRSNPKSLLVEIPREDGIQEGDSNGQ
jgi:hypothetical protein